MATLVPLQPLPGNLARPVRKASSSLLVYLAAALFYLLLLPEQLDPRVLGSALPPYRIFLIASTLFVIYVGATRRFRLLYTDIVIILATAWICLAMFVNTGGVEALTASIANLCDILFAYLFARIALQTPRDLRLLLVLAAPGIAMLGASLLVESVTKVHWVQQIVSSVTGNPVRIRSEFRMGLLRASGPFSHQILAGVFLASFLPLYMLSGLRGWPKKLGSISPWLSFFSLSSAAIIALGMGGALLIYEWLSKRFAQLTWRLAMVLLGLPYILLEVLSPINAFSLVTRYASLDSGTGYFRMAIWEYGSRNVAKYPWFGIGYREYERPAWMVTTSVDHYWLFLGIRFGAIVPLLLILAVILAVFSASRASMVGPPADRALLRGLAMSVAVLAICAISVAFWHAIQIWFYFILAVSVTLSSRQLVLSDLAVAVRKREIAASQVASPSV